MEKINRVDEFVFPFEKLEVWQLAVDLTDFILGLLVSFHNTSTSGSLDKWKQRYQALLKTSQKAKGGNTRKSLFNCCILQKDRFLKF